MLEIKRILTESCILSRSEPIVVGVSGGPDSLCLAHFLLREGYSPIITHYNHQLRPQADQEEDHVRLFAAHFGLPFYNGRGDVAERALREKLSLEEAARKSRYEYLFSVAREVNAQAVAVAHHADDQVETILMHLLRGSGLSGLRGMRCFLREHPWSEDIPLVRPLLSIWREEIIGYCEAHKLQPVFDPSNNDPQFYRNRFRLELIPYLETYNPQVKQLLWRMADGLGLDEEVLDKTVNEALVGCNFNREKGWVRLNRKAFLQLLTGLQQRIIRQAVFYLQEDLRDIDYLAVKRAIDFLNNPTSTNRIDLMAGLLVLAEEDDFYIAYWNATLPLDNFPQIDHEMDVRKVRSYPLTNNWEMRLEVVKRPDMKQVRTNRDPFACWLDLEKITFPIIVRGYRAGERFTPMGMAGHSLKVSDYFTNNKVPRRARNQLPILVERKEILWLTHGPPAEGRGVTESTRRALKIFYSQKEITKKPK